MKSKKYIAIVKIRNDKDGSAKCVKYRFDNLLKFTEFLDKKWSECKWYNVFSNRGNNEKKQIASYTNRNKPTKSHV